MSSWTGIIDPSGSPRIRISVYGINQGFAREFDALVDTGFSGFLSMHMVQAFPLGLVLSGTTKITLADGSQVTNLTTVGVISIGGEQQSGIILLENNPCDILVGMDFLRAFHRVLLVHAVHGMVLVEEKIIEDFVNKAQAQQTSPPSPANPTP